MTVITEKPRAADRTERMTEAHFEDRNSLTQPQVGQYIHPNTFEVDGKAGKLNMNKSAHFTAPYVAKYNDNPAPTRYQPDQTNTVITELPRA